MLLFVYNANISRLSGLLDSLHKTFSPSTYPCKLCSLTYGLISIKNGWRDYLGELTYEKKFLHKNEFILQYPALAHTALPAVFFGRHELSLLIAAEEFNAINTLDELINLMDIKLNAIAVRGDL